MTDAVRPRPRVHFTPQAGWINDPLALTWHNGRYHLFFQFVPGQTEWAPQCRWGHATSADLLTWTEHPVAIEPGDGDDGIWSGSIAIDDAGRPTLFYTSVTLPDLAIGRIRTATPTDDTWMTWEKGPVAADAPALEESGLDVVAFRDPFLTREVGANGDARWRMLVGTALRGGDAAASAFSSTDLVTWSFDGLAASRNAAETDPVWTGSLWECPQVFSIDGRDVLLTSVWQNDELHSVAYGVGEFADGRFRAESWGRLSYGPSYYAPSFFRDADGRACVIYWMRGVLDADAGRASALSVPHVLSRQGDVLVAEPHPAVAGLGLGWNTAEDGELHVAGPTPVRVQRRGGLLVITHDGSETTVPIGSDLVRVLVDAETLELFTDQGVFALGAAHPFGPVTLSA
ncbi:glycoside hydrolase family 32 protein [Cryobacterium melibiosiphilum]|uniref:beta-fructofuranosidase n=1 Tax=Cryobacterium melibiosiphilum TaxID=995039 RepID=A0A3A5MQK3_9MICO|nr:glycoside hydrolase family 32 protein [Cryobacterium melibiosiphilum]RJT91632.1 glycoside hydrolase family 32 protein [Cryobacterium melibiosiphilum]